VDTAAQPFEGVVDGHVGRQDHHGDLEQVRVALDPVDQRGPVRTDDSFVGQEHFGLLRPARVERRYGVGAGDHLVSDGCKDAARMAAHVRGGMGDEDAHGQGRRSGGLYPASRAVTHVHATARSEKLAS